MPRRSPCRATRSTTTRRFYKKAGLDPEKPPTTWDAMLSDCAAIKQATDVPCFAVGNKEGYGIQFWMSGLGSGILTPAEYDNWIAGKRDWNSPNVKKIFALWKEANDNGLNTEGPNSTAMFMDAFTNFEGGKAANMIGLMSDVGGWHEMNPILGADNLGVMLSPVVTTGAVPSLAYDGGVGYGVAKWTKDPALAADLVRSLTSTDALSAYATDAGAIASDKTVTIAGGGPAAATIATQIPDGKPALHVALSAKTQDVMGRVSQQLLSGVDHGGRRDEATGRLRPGELISCRSEARCRRSARLRPGGPTAAAVRPAPAGPAAGAPAARRAMSDSRRTCSSPPPSWSSWCCGCGRCCSA